MPIIWHRICLIQHFTLRVVEQTSGPPFYFLSMYTDIYEPPIAVLFLIITRLQCFPHLQPHLPLLFLLLGSTTSKTHFISKIIFFYLWCFFFFLLFTMFYIKHSFSRLTFFSPSHIPTNPKLLRVHSNVAGCLPWFTTYITINTHEIEGNQIMYIGDFILEIGAWAVCHVAECEKSLAGNRCSVAVKRTIENNPIISDGNDVADGESQKCISLQYISNDSFPYRQFVYVLYSWTPFPCFRFRAWLKWA